MINAAKKFWKRVSGGESRQLHRQLQVNEASWELACELIELKDSHERALKSEIAELEARIAVLQYDQRKMQQRVDEWETADRERFAIELARQRAEDTISEDLFDLSILDTADMIREGALA